MQPDVMRRWAGFGAKAAVTAVLVWLVLGSVDLQAVGARMAALSPVAGALAVALLMLHCFIAGWRWQIVMRLFGPVLPLRQAIRLFIEGYFFNNALPSTVGGDAVRIWRARAAGLPLAASIGGVLLDRVTGLAGLFLLVLAGQPLLYARIADGEVRLAFAAILAAGAAGIALLILARRIPAPLLPDVLRDDLRALSEATHRAFLHPAVSVPVLGLSVVVHGLIVLSVYVIALGLGLDVGLFESLVLVPAVILLSTAPVSIGGWGLREGLMVVALGLAGIPAEAALGVSVLFGIAQIVAGLPGGLLWLAADGARSSADLD